MQKQYKLTEKALQDLKNEYQHLKTVREREVAEQIKEARSYGDLSENSEYDEAKNEQGKLYSRIAELEYILTNYILIDENASGDEVMPGCKVVVKCLEDEEEDTYYIVGSQEANPVLGRVSDESPIGKALIGSKVGEVVTVDAPMGHIKYMIIEITR